MPDDIDERLSRRFGGEKKDKNDTRAKNEKNDWNDSSEENEMKADPTTASEESTQGDTNDKNGTRSKNGWNVTNVKKEWTPRSIYLPDTIEEDLGRTFKRLDLDLDMAGIDREFRKTRHFYPLLVALGMQRMEEMEPEELMEFLEELERKEREE
ncbi:hypothetical protein [Halopelagius fulvigenes]|uniref:DUF8160 domain-containing protein n=1 Tax=Halopelagius fulvigenes TaxID=1198324 RepID=A0ABD5U186_9EURY